jgi:hypothetical protein
MIMDRLSLFMSMSILILININISHGHEKASHVNLFFSYSCWWVRKEMKLLQGDKI